MNHLNYFKPFDSKNSSHEDQLTRAYLVLLKHSVHAFFIFIEYARNEHRTSGKERPFSIISFLEEGWQIETQKTNPAINTDSLLSILITDSQINATNTNVQSCERSARYDGIITFGENLTVVIENKPRSENVWFGQLNPSRQNLNEDTIVYSAPIILQWKEIIKQLTYLLNAPTISGYEKIMIEDFLSYIDESFPFLNPYDSFDQCKRNPELLRRRINSLLKEIALDESRVGYHRSGSYYIQTTYNQIERICLGLGQIEDEWFIGLALCFGDTQRQAISFYRSNPKIGCLNKANWKVSPNFHVSFKAQNLISFKSKDSEKYLQFWKDNVEEIHQQKRGDVPKYFKWLVDSKVIEMDPKIRTMS